MTALDLSGTRTSDCWKRVPGNFDRLNLRSIYQGAGEWGLPQLAPEPSLPSELVPWHYPGEFAGAGERGGAVHFFLDDYRFEQAWNQPERALRRLRAAGAALTPDFSLWLGMPLAAQVWQVYRSRWLGAYWQHEGLKVWPTVAWSGPESYGFCFAGLPEGSPVAVSAVGVRSRGARQLFAAGLDELLYRARPSHLIVYGGLPDECLNLDLPEVTEHKSFWAQRGKAAKLWADAVAAAPAEARAEAEAAAWRTRARRRPRRSRAAVPPRRPARRTGMPPRRRARRRAPPTRPRPRSSSRGSRRCTPGWRTGACRARTPGLRRRGCEDVPDEGPHPERGHRPRAGRHFR